MANDLHFLFDTLDDALRAYRQRIAELESTVQTQQRIIEELRNPQAGEPPRQDGDEKK